MKYLIQLLPGTYACPRLDRSNRCTPRLLGRESLVLVLGILCLGCSAVGQNLVSNGSFELPVVSGSFIQRNAGTTMSGWTVGGGGIDHIGNFWMAAATNQSVDLNAASAGSVYQLLSTTPDTRYVLRFALAGNPFGYSNKVMSVLWGGLPLTNLVFYWYATNSVTNMGWQYYSLVVTSTAASTRLEFASLTGAMNGAQGTTAFYGPALDYVSVTAFSRPVLAVPGVTNETTTVTWTTFAGLNYQLLSSTNLNDWLPASGWVTAASNNWSEVVPLDSSRNKFFRVQVAW